MKITPADVAYIAALANLEVPETEVPGLAAELSRIVDYVEKLNELDIEGVEPTSHVSRSAPHPEREDRVAPRDGSGDAALTVHLFKVPRVISNR